MGLEPEFLKQLLDTFAIELDELLQELTSGLLQLEQADPANASSIMDSAFRVAHNIKGTARSLNINDVADIAHHLESLFSSLQKKSLLCSPELITLCLEAGDKMRWAMSAFLQNQGLSFNLPDLLTRLDEGQLSQHTESQSTQIQQAEYISPEMIRVSVERLDSIAGLMEELQANKIALDDHYVDLTQLHLKAEQLLKSGKNAADPHNIVLEISHSIAQIHQNLQARINELSILSHSLQEEIRTLRLLPAATLLQTLPRIARDLANTLNKKITLHIHGDEVKMDKMILEGLKDPIIHLLRNAIDHGIELPEQRKASGKSETGHIKLAIIEEGNQILFRIEDDGAGINVDKIAEIALRKNLISKSECAYFSDAEKLDLLFLPGFSSAEIITDISGRGMGLNIVKENIERLKGQVSIDTELKHYTAFNVRVPLTLAIERGLMVRSGGQYFVIPTVAIERILSLPVEQLVDVGSGQAILLDGHSIPLRVLADVLNLKQKESFVTKQLQLVIIKKESHSLAFLVEEIVGEREMVIKPLQPPLHSIRGIAGGTLTGGRHVVMVLNTSDLMTIALHEGQRTRFTPEHVTKHHILVVDDSITTRTLEKSILEHQGYQVTTAVNGKEAWDLLQKNQFSLLITDAVMPFVDGFTLTERVKKSQSYQNMPVVIVTSLGSDAEKKRGIEVGADAYIVKSEFESGKLLEIVSLLVSLDD